MVPNINVNLKPCICATSASGTHSIVRRVNGEHEPACPGAPVFVPFRFPTSMIFVIDGTKVACSIGGESLDGARIDDVELVQPNHIRLVTVTDTCRMQNACIARLALIVNLLTGHLTETGDETGLVGQRNKLFSAVADMARAEDAAADAQKRVGEALPRRPAFVHHRRGGSPLSMPSSSAIAEYVDELIERVGVLP